MYLFPNAFTPNGDGINDEIKVYSLCRLSYFRLNIYKTRFGNLVFSSDNMEQSWNGMYNGKHASIGVYYYTIEAKSLEDGAAKIFKKGNITLVR